MSFVIDALCPVSVQDALFRAAALAPDVEALVAPDGRATFAQLADRVAGIRAALAASGVRKGDHVGICLGNGIAFEALFLALGTLGAISVPVNTRLKADEIAYALRQSRVTRLFTADTLLNADFIAILRDIAPGIVSGLPDAALPDLREIVVLGDDVPAACMAWGDFMADGKADPGPQATPDDTLLIQYTSGTTAFPKGVMLTHRNMLGNGFVSGQRIGLRTGDRFHSSRPFFHVAGSTLSILACLQNLATLVTMTRFEPEQALLMLEDERCTHFSGNDTMALMLLNHPSRAARKLCLRGGWIAGSQAVLRRVATEMNAREVVSGYGLSEASPNIAQSCWWEPEDVRTGGRMRPQPGLEVVVIDPATGAACGPGGAGEIRVRGWSVMQGYYDMPDKTTETLSADGWLSTGDLGRIGEDGRLEFVGRLKNIVRVGGENVSPEEVEDRLHQHPAIKQAQVVGVPDDRLVEVCAVFLILNEGESLSPDALIDWARDKMAGFKVPRHVWIVNGFEDIGMTASSKIQKTKLAAHARALLEEEHAA
ncbi:AMP-binding protein [Puniceibacterium sp. IMCC21224]|uniref:AMP-binding protein n=1 Tax=Puniceibacterium sp. IMCC21224 TaxID=1618204 RepID=UPI00064DA345|nr:AMP-binding protein [Puniceibacterium sp. IMCC21224]KMK65129.1 acyl-CoA synthetase (AMP-forming)/AMP-acid ligase II [Puniceibacterium sp. IMCC21224]